MLYGKKTFRRALLTLAASAVLVPLGQGSATAAGATGAAVPAPVPGPAVVVPGAVLSTPPNDTLLVAGSSGFLREQGTAFVWTPYGGGAGTTLAGLVDSGSARSIGGWYGDGSDTVAVRSPSGTSVVLHDMAHGGATSTVTVPTGQVYEGTYGSTVLTRTSGAAPQLHLLDVATDGSTSDRPVTGLSGDTALGGVYQGDAHGVVFEYSDGTAFHLAQVDLAKASVSSVSGVLGRALSSTAQLSVGPDKVVVETILQGVGVQVYDRGDLSAAPHAVGGIGNAYEEPHAYAVVGGQLLWLSGPSSVNGTSTAGLTAQPLDGSADGTVLPVVLADVLPTPDGGALVVGSTAVNDPYAVYRIAPGSGDAVPTASRTADVVPVEATTAGIALDHGTLSVVDNSGDDVGYRYETLYTRPLTLTGPGAPAAGDRQPGANLQSVGSCGTAYACSAQLTATGDGNAALLQANAPTKWLSTSTLEGGQGSTNTLLDADGNFYADLTGSNVSFADFTSPEQAPISYPGTAAATWSGRVWTGGADGGLVSVFDPVNQTLVATFDTGAPCALKDLQVVGRWVYWACDDHTAGVYDWTRKAGFTLPTTGHGYDDALLGDGFLVYHDSAAGQLVLADVHTGALTSTQNLTALDGGTTGPDRKVRWTVDRYTGAVAWTDADNAVHAEQTGVPASAPAVPPAGSLPPAAVPDWLIPVVTTRSGSQGTTDARACTGIAISYSRVLTGADCFTGRTDADTWWTADPHTHAPSGGGSGFPYRTAPQYNASTRQADLGVHVDFRGNLQGVTTAPVLATAADTTLYRAGAAATFYSWTGVGNGSDAPRSAHAEPAVVRSAADCATLLGHALPSGTICTSPGPGAAVVSAQRCMGDDGGALVAGGKLIGVGATATAGCSAAGVRLYTSIAALHELVQGWAHDIYGSSGIDGAVAAVTSDGWIYSSCGDPMKDCVAGGSGQALAHNSYNLVEQFGDLNSDGWGDLLERTNSGKLYLATGYHDDVHSDLTKDASVGLGAGWNIYNQIMSPGDMSGDGLPDILARDTGGHLWLYPSNGHNGFGARINLGAGWNAYTLLAHGDFSGDAIADLIFRDKSGNLWRRNGNGRGGLTAGNIKLGYGWSSFTSLVAVGDQDGQGRNQIIGRLANGQIDRWSDNGRGGLTALTVLGGNSELRNARLN